MRRTTRTTLALAGALVLAGCAAPAENDPYQQEAVTAPVELAETEYEVVTDWRKLDAPGNYDSFVRVVLINGECFVEEYNSYAGSVTLAGAAEACDR